MKCAYCGKYFRVTNSGWGYAYGGLYTCSYHCMRAMREEDVTETMPMTQEKKERIDQLEEAGLGYEEIAKEIGMRTQQVVGYIGAKKRHGRKAEKQTEDAGVTEEKQEKKPEMPPRETRVEIRDLDGTADRVLRMMEDMLEVIRKIYGV